MKKEIGNGVAYLGDCLEVMEKLIEQGIKVDVIICDPPYNLTACAWDKLIPFDKMWEKLNKLIKPNGAIVLFGSEPFSSALRMSNIKNYKYDWIWDKKNANGGLLVKKQPMKRTENISIFYKKQCTYNFQLEEKEKKYIREIKKEYKNIGIYSNETKINFFAPSDKTRTIPINKKYPSNIISISSGSHKKRIHPTQKPVALIEYLIKTYTNEGELVLDFTSGSGTTGVACQNLNRRFILIEKDETYFNLGIKRILNLIK